MAQRPFVTREGVQFFHDDLNGSPYVHVCFPRKLCLCDLLPRTPRANTFSTQDRVFLRHRVVSVDLPTFDRFEIVYAEEGAPDEQILFSNSTEARGRTLIDVVRMIEDGRRENAKAC